MRDRRNSNRKRVKKGLKDAGKPAPLELVSQGSYAMKTMVWNPELDYDIDDGIYFRKEDLVGPRGGEMSPRQARETVRDAVDDGSFKTAPEVRKTAFVFFTMLGITSINRCTVRLLTKTSGATRSFTMNSLRAQRGFVLTHVMSPIGTRTSASLAWTALKCAASTAT